MYILEPNNFDVEQLRALLLEIVRRAAYDWVMYRSSKRLLLKQMARDAYVWLFVEGPGHKDWEEREEEGWQLFSFLGICSALDLEPKQVRHHVRKLTPQRIQSMGRPPVHRKYPPPRPELDYVESVGLRTLLQLVEGGDVLSFE